MIRESGRPDGCHGRTLNWLVDRLICPNCGASMATTAAGFECRHGHTLIFHDGYLDASMPVIDEVTERTFRSFGFEWNKFDQVRLEDADFWQAYSQDLRLAEFHDVIGLDAGCGKGRFSRYLAEHLAGLVALDGSSAVLAAARNLASMTNTVVIKADLQAKQFRPASFGFICSLGVLHHLGQPEEGFLHLVDLLEPGGTLLLYLYSRPECCTGVRARSLAAASILRRLTIKIPYRLLITLSAPLALLLQVTFVAPGVLGDRMRIKPLMNLPLRTYRHRPFRSLWLDTFDRLSAPVEHRYVWSELQDWFNRANLEIKSARDDAGWFVVLKKRAITPGI